MCLALLFVFFLSTAHASPLQSREAFEKEIATVLDVDEFHREMASLDEEVEREAATHEKELQEQLAKLEPEPVRSSNEQTLEEVNAAILPDLFEGDILLTNEQLETGRKKRQAYTPPGRFPANQWPTNRPIPFQFNARVPESDRAIFREAAKFWQENTCLSFQENAPGVNVIEVINGGGCFSELGMIAGKKQELSLAHGGCSRFSTASHELEHALGVYHEQARSDREKFVAVNTGVIDKYYAHNFNKENDTFTKNYDVPYEFGSNMHYTADSFSNRPGTPALVVQRGYEEYQNSMRGHMPSFYDVLLVNKYYKCTDRCRVANFCRNGGYVNVKTCNTCVCPEGWGGRDCTAKPDGACSTEVTATTAVQTQKMKVGTYGMQKIRHDNCYLVINAPTGRRVEVTVKSMQMMEGEGCHSNGLEIKKAKDFGGRGIRHCGNIAPKKAFVSEGNRVAILIYSNYYESNAEIQYRAV